MKNVLYLLLVILISASCRKGTVKPEQSITYKIPDIADPVPGRTVDTIPIIRKYHNVVILGNSITFSMPDPSIDWYNDWGMAASKPEFDYVHLLTAKLKVISPDVKISLQQTYVFEKTYTTYDYVTNFAGVKALHPDLLIMRFGENVEQDSVGAANFDAIYGSLIAYFKDGNPDVKILAVGSFWGNAVVDGPMKKYSKFVTLSPLLSDPGNQAFGQYANYGVSIHPSDKGMKQICSIIWGGLNGL
ncbi:MAG TPA: hypothetical protein VGC08_11305 [Pedobacter sp.]